MGTQNGKFVTATDIEFIANPSERYPYKTNGEVEHFKSALLFNRSYEKIYMKLFQNLMKRYHPKENSKQLIKLIFKCYGNLSNVGAYITLHMLYQILSLLESGTRQQQLKILCKLFEINYDTKMIKRKEFIKVANEAFNISLIKANTVYKELEKQKSKIPKTIFSEFLSVEKSSVLQKKAALMIEVLVHYSIAVHTLKKQKFMN